MYRFNRMVGIALVSLWLVGCVYIPKASVTLSESMTEMILSARASHLALIDHYMLEKRGDLDSMFQQKWVPRFMSIGLEQSGFLELMENAESDSERALLLDEFMSDAGSVITEQRTILVNGLDETERMLKEPVIAHYDDMLSVNAALTAHLRAASDVVETRDQILSSLSINPRELLPLDLVNGHLDRLIGLGNSTAARADSVQANVNDILNVIRETLKGVQDGTLP